MPTIAERLETATSQLEAQVSPLSTAVTTCTTKATEAATSATAAAGSATTATTKAADAETARAAAVTAKNAAETAQTAAAGSATTAGTHATNAGNSATAAADSATTAGTHATNAGNSATAAATSQTAAAASATAAGNSQTAAATSATASAASAATATTQAGNASTSAAAAAASAATAAAIAAGLNFKGTLAGASVPSTSTLAGDCYLISSPGTSQTITWAAGDLAVYRGTSGQWSQMPASVVMALATSLRNNAARRGGLAFTGGTNGRMTANLTSQTIGQGEFGFSFMMEVPKVAPGTELFVAVTTNSVGANLEDFYLSLTTGDILRFNHRYATTDHSISIANFCATYGGKTVLVSYSESGTAKVAYVDAVAKTTAAASVGNLTLGTLNINSHNGSNTFYGKISDFVFYNVAPTAADMLEILELGGGVPERLKRASQTPVYTSDFSAGTQSWNGDNQTPTGNIDQDADGAGVPPSNDWLRAVTDATETLYQYSAPLSNYFTFPSRPIGAKFRVTGDVFVEAASGATHVVITWTGNGSDVKYAPITAGAVSSFDVTLTSILPMVPRVSIALNTGGSGSTSYPSGTRLYLKNVKIYELGAVAIYPLDDGIGLQMMDVSVNKLHGLLTTSGVEHVVPLAIPGRVRGTTSTNGNQQLLGNTCIPALHQIIRVRARSRTGTPSVTLGLSSGANQVVASVALSTTWKELAIQGTMSIQGANQSLWVNSTSTNVIEWDISHEQLSF